MNPQDVFKQSLLSQSTPSGAGLGSFFRLSKPAVAGISPAARSFISSIPAAPQDKLPSLTGGNPAATTPATPKSSYIDSQVSTPSTPPPQTNPNYGMQIPGGATGTKPPGDTTPTSDPNAYYRSAFDTYLASLQPSADETAASKNLSALTLQSQKDQEEALNRGETMGFATGEAARVNKNNSFAIDAASNSLNALTAARTGQTNATKARLDFEKSLLPDPTKSPYTEVSPGASLFDPKTGKSIYTAPTTASQNGSGTGGTSATVNAIIANPGLWNQLTATARTALIPQLTAAGFDTKKLNLLSLPAGQQSDLETFGSVQNYISDLLATAGTSGDLAGVGGFGQGSIGQLLYGNLGDVPGSGGAAGQSNRNLIGQIQGAIAKLRGGTSFTPNEQALLQTYTPTINDSDAAIVQKLKDLNTFVENKKANITSLAGGSLPSGATSAKNQAKTTPGADADYAAYLKAIGQ